MLEVPRPSPVSHKTSRRRGFSEFQDLPSLLDVGDRHGNHEARWRKLLLILSHGLWLSSQKSACNLLATAYNGENVSHALL